MVTAVTSLVPLAVLLLESLRRSILLQLRSWMPTVVVATLVSSRVCSLSLMT